LSAAAALSRRTFRTGSTLRLDRGSSTSVCHRAATFHHGHYNCQVTVIDPTGGKASFWQAPVVLVP